MPVVVAALVVVQGAFAILLRCRKRGPLENKNYILNHNIWYSLEIVKIVEVEIYSTTRG